LFTILLDNAIKYSPANTTITLISKKRDNGIIIEVSDQGIGIEEKDISRIFERFYRADKSRTKTDVSGYGLGLSIAKQIVEDHNGIILVKSTVGRGTTFFVSLPL
jgi:signal transduction histidine kinase